MIRRMFALCLLFALAAAAPAGRGAESFAIGVMNDQSGPYADLAGPGSVEIGLCDSALAQQRRLFEAPGVKILVAA